MIRQIVRLRQDLEKDSVSCDSSLHLCVFRVQAWVVLGSNRQPCNAFKKNELLVVAYLHDILFWYLVTERLDMIYWYKSQWIEDSSGKDKKGIEFSALFKRVRHGQETLDKNTTLKSEQRHRNSALHDTPPCHFHFAIWDNIIFSFLRGKFLLAS